MASSIKVDLAKVTSRCKKLTTQVIIYFVIYDCDSIDLFKVKYLFGNYLYIMTTLFFVIVCVRIYKQLN